MDESPNVTGNDLPVCRSVRPGDAAALGYLFERLRRLGVEKFFHPHPVTQEEAAKRVAYTGKDVFCVMQLGSELIGYGMLRGWDEGYEIPSLGIVIDPQQQGRGHGRRLMEFLHNIARQRGASQVRLRVHPQNARAVKLYQSLGYVFNGQDRGEMLGFLELSPAKTPPRKQHTK